jgi:hypothetical protein
VVLKSFHMDDLFSTMSWFLMLVTVICATLEAPISYQFSSILIGETPMPSPDELAGITITLRKWNVGGQMLFWTALYCVKLSFMFLYRIVLGSNKKHQSTWTAALIYIMICYGICLIGVFGQCGDASNLFSYGQFHHVQTLSMRISC